MIMGDVYAKNYNLKIIIERVKNTFQSHSGDPPLGGRREVPGRSGEVL